MRVCSHLLKKLLTENFIDLCKHIDRKLQKNYVASLFTFFKPYLSEVLSTVLVSSSSQWLVDLVSISLLEVL